MWISQIMDCLPSSIGHHHLQKFHPIKFINGKFQQQLLSKSLVLNFDPGDFIFRKNEPRTQSHYLVSGIVEVRDSFFSRNRVESTDERAHYSLDNEAYVQSCAIAKSKVTVLSLNTDYIDFLLARSEEEENKVVSIGTAQAAKKCAAEASEDPDWIWRVINGPVFAKLPPSNMMSKRDSACPSLR